MKEVISESFKPKKINSETKPTRELKRFWLRESELVRKKL